MGKPVAKLVMPVGSSSASNTVSSLTVKCHQTRPSVVVMMLSTLSSAKLELVSTSQDVSSSISNQPLLMKSEPEPTDNCSILNNSSQEKKMPPITSPEVITPSEERSSILLWTESENWLTTVPVFKDSWSSKPSVVVPVPVSVPSFWKDFPSITVRNP